MWDLWRQVCQVVAAPSNSNVNELCSAVIHSTRENARDGDRYEEMNRYRSYSFDEKSSRSTSILVCRVTANSQTAFPTRLMACKARSEAMTVLTYQMRIFTRLKTSHLWSSWEIIRISAWWRASLDGH